MLIDRIQTVTPEHSRSHIRFPFRLPREASKLHIHFAYGPKALEDREASRRLMEECISKYIEPERQPIVRGSMERYYPLTNLMTLSVDDPEAYRGACHRHDPEQRLFLSGEEASPGLAKGPLPAGLWTVTISVHSIVTERCEYRLQVWAEEEEA